MTIMKKTLTLIAVLAAALTATAQVKVSVHETAQDQPVIPAEIYGQFSEHLGKCIYEGIWVGKDSSIPNVNGYRTDVLDAFRALKVPVLRWPGGCFGDEYHWMDGIGPQENRKGTVEELAKWVEYMTAQEGSMAELRAKNGRKEPWKVKYLGVGNESWGCGGDMTADYYSDVYKRYALYARNYSGNRLYKVACGASDYDYNWTKVMMQNARTKMDALSLHYYTCKGWTGSKGSATNFTTEEYYNVLAKTCEIEEVLKNHFAIMDAYDPDKKVALILDEWGTWFDVEPGTNPGWLFQQNTMRDAIVAALNLNIFQKHTDRLKMANIAQIVNVLQAMILTDGEKMVLTPTYHVFRMFNVHQNATYVPSDYTTGNIVSAEGRIMDDFSACASRDSAGKLHISLANPYLDKPVTVELAFDQLKPKTVTGEILKADKINAYNEFGKAPAVAPAAFTGAKATGKGVKLTLPAASVVVLEIQ